MKKVIRMSLKITFCTFIIGMTYIGSLLSDIAFMTDWNQQIYMFDTSNPGGITSIIDEPGLSPDCITVSPDGKTVYFTSNINPGDVYSFPVSGPYTPTPLGLSLDDPIGLAISSDGSTCYVISDGTGEIFSFLINNPTIVTTLSRVGPTDISSPTFIAIKGDTAYVASYQSGNIYSFPLTPGQTTYNATLIQSPGENIGGIAISNDGYLYWSITYTFTDNGIYRVPLTAPTSSPEALCITIDSLDGIAISNDSKTCFVIQYSGSDGISTLPTDQGTGQSLTPISIQNGIAIGIVPALPSLNTKYLYPRISGF